MLKEEIEQMIKATNKETNKLERKLKRSVTESERARIYHELLKVEERRKTLAEVLKLFKNLQNEIEK